MREALAQAMVGSGKPGFVFLFATPGYEVHRLNETLLKYAGAVKVLGCLAEGLIAEERYLTEGVVVLTLGGDDFEVQTFASAKAPVDSYAVGEDLGRAIHREGFIEGTLIMLVDPAMEVPLFLQGLYNLLGPSFVYLGGGAGVARWTEKGVEQSAVSVAAFRGIDFAVGAGHGWTPTQELFVVTGAKGREVVEIDGVSPFEAYRRRVGDFAREELDRVGVLYPLGFPNMYGQFLIRDPVYFTPEGTMGFVGARVPQGAVGYMMKGERESLLAAAEQAAQKAILGITEPAFALIFDCVSRPLLLQEEFRHEVTLVKKTLGQVPVSGFLSDGEIRPLGRAPVFWNKNIVVAVAGKGIRERESNSETRDSLLEAELAILHEISALAFPGSYEELFWELVERAVRLFAIQRMGFCREKEGKPELVVAWGFSSLEDVQHVIKYPEARQYVFSLRKEGTLLLEAPRNLSVREERLYTIFARKVETVLCEARRWEEREQQIRSLEHLSFTDELTALFNRRGFFVLVEQALAQARKAGKIVGVVLFDVDELKLINDYFGHSEGDQILREFGQILRQAFRKSDIIARLGGDEFVVFLTDVEAAQVENIVGRLQDLVEAWNEKAQYPYRLSFSSGWVLAHPAKVGDVGELMALADKQMYREKHHKRGKRNSKTIKMDQEPETL